MKLVKNYGQISLKLIFLNIFFIFMVLILQPSLNGAGTGDIYEGYEISSLYLILKCIFYISISIALLFYFFYTKRVHTTALIFICYGILLFGFVKIFGKPINPPSDTRDWGYDTIKGNIILLNVDCFVVLIFSIVSSILGFLKKHGEAILSMPINVVLLFSYIYFTISKWGSYLIG